MPSKLAADPFSFLAVIIGAVVFTVMAQRFHYLAKRQRLMHIITASLIGAFSVPWTAMVYNFIHGWQPRYFVEIAFFVVYTGATIGITLLLVRAIRQHEVTKLAIPGWATGFAAYLGYMILFGRWAAMHGF